MLQKILHWGIILVWFINGLYCKILNAVPRHEAIVARILGEEYARPLTLLIGLAELLTNTLLGKRLCLALGCFWACRLWIQWFGYSAILWKGKVFETTIHIIFTCFWSYLTYLFSIIALS